MLVKVKEVTLRTYTIKCDNCGAENTLTVSGNQERIQGRLEEQGWTTNWDSQKDYCFRCNLKGDADNNDKAIPAIDGTKEDNL